MSCRTARSKCILTHRERGGWAEAMLRHFAARAVPAPRSAKARMRGLLYGAPPYNKSALMRAYDAHVRTAQPLTPPRTSSTPTPTRTWGEAQHTRARLHIFGRKQ